MTDSYILSAARTPIGTFGGSLASVAPIDFATTAATTALARAGLAPERIGQVVFGHVINTGPRDGFVKGTLLETGQGAD
jgi:acetyl-CoA C-acetyltransferase